MRLKLRLVNKQDRKRTTIYFLYGITTFAKTSDYVVTFYPRSEIPQVFWLIMFISYPDDALYGGLLFEDVLL